jgi:ADP-ribose pyrophosphatase YjhB (NUDIX family)
MKVTETILEQVRTSARAIIQQDESLLVIRYRDERGDWYVLPGGGQRHRESLHASLVREVAEETGAVIRVGLLRFVRECMAAPDSRALPAGFHQVELFFACELVTPPAGGSRPDPTQVAAEWCTLKELRNRCFFPQALLDALESGQQFGYLGVV